jgi:hypothetical protein
MFASINCTDDPSVYYFTYITLGLDDREWHHTMPKSPLLNWVDSILIPLAKEKGNSLTIKNVLQAMNKLTEEARISLESLDWLGLALLSTQRYWESLGQLAAGPPSTEIEEACAARRKLTDICCQIYQQLSLVRHDSFRLWLSSAA